MSKFVSFSGVKEGPPDAILGIKKRFLADLNLEQRTDVTVGAYRDENGKPVVLQVVRKAEELILNNQARTKEYLPMAGDPAFIAATQDFCFGSDSPSLKQGRIATVQALSGTGALRVGGEFLANHFPGAVVHIPDPTWGNHFAIFKNAGLQTAKYRYWNASSKGLDFEAMTEDLLAIPSGDIVILHVCSHNPTGVDPNEEQWQKIAEICQSRKLLPFFDSAYQGFATGDVDKDAYAVRLFDRLGMCMLVAQSYSKNMGLYGERIGALNVVLDSPEAKVGVISQLEIVIRPMYSNPPRHGAAIVALILSDPVLRDEWKVELKAITNRIREMRVGLRKAVEATGAPGHWDFITDQIGMFTFTGLSAEQVGSMEKNYHIYMTSNGRISVAGLTSDKLEHVAKAIRSVL